MKRLLFALALLVSSLWAQSLTTPINVIPDCLVYFDFTANGSSAQFDNRFIGCKTWYVAYTNTGFPALTLTFQDAPDASGVPGAWAAFAGTIAEGVNPNVALTQASTVLYGYYPWQRITLTGVTAGASRRIRGTFYGYRQTPVATVIFPAIAALTANQGAANTDPNRWPVYLSDGASAQGTQTNPLFNRLSDGTNPVDCPYSAAFSFTPASTVASNVILAVVPGLSIHVCTLSLSNSGATDLTIVQGTGAACVGTPAVMSGLYRNVLSMALPFGVQPLRLTSAWGLCLNSSAAVNIGGMVTYGTY